MNDLAVLRQEIETLKAQLAAQQAPTVGGKMANALTESAKRGLKRGSVAEAQRQIRELTYAMLPGLERTPTIDVALSLVVPAVLLMAGTVLDDKIEDPMLRKIMAGATESAGMALEGVTQKSVETALAVALPQLLALATVSCPELAQGE